MQKEPKYYQFYDIHMKNGKVLSYAEDFDIPAGKGIIGDFKRGTRKFLEYGDLFHGYTIPFDQISFIVATAVKQGI